MASTLNEGKACDAVVKLLEKQTGKKRIDISCPEKNGIGPPVDLRLNLGTQDYAIEHTLIEAFAGQVHMGQEFGQFIEPVVDKLSGTLPKPGIYYLYFPTNARLKVKANQLDELRNGFVEWVREQAQQLHDKNPDRPTREWNPRGIEDKCRATPPGFPYEVTLRREAHWSLSPHHDGILLVARYAPEDVEKQRPARLLKALKDKCPKLRLCKEGDARTVLVLEDNDISLSNHVLISEGLAGLLEGLANLPDEIYLVETTVKTWDVRPLKIDDNILLGNDWAEFDSSKLTDITNDVPKRT